MNTNITKILEKNILIIRSLEECIPGIERAIELIIDTYSKNGKILLFGNGGSAADSQHIATELVVRFQKNRRALAAIALTTNNCAITACANDYGFDHIFKRQVEALANENDCVIAISTSGASNNVINGAKEARENGCKVISLTGNNPTELSTISDVTISVPSNDTARIQEAHIMIGHIICQLVEEKITNDSDE